VFDKGKLYIVYVEYISFQVHDAHVDTKRKAPLLSAFWTNI